VEGYVGSPSVWLSSNRESRLTQRAPDGWESPRFQAVSLAPAGSVKAV
jgi:hypothetical protein